MWLEKQWVCRLSLAYLYIVATRCRYVYSLLVNACMYVRMYVCIIFYAKNNVELKYVYQNKRSLLPACDIKNNS